MMAACFGTGAVLFAVVQLANPELLGGRALVMAEVVAVIAAFSAVVMGLNSGRQSRWLLEVTRPNGCGCVSSASSRTPLFGAILRRAPKSAASRFAMRSGLFLGAVHFLLPRVLWSDGVVPLGTDVVTMKSDAFELGVGDSDLLGIVTGVKFGGDLQAGSGGGSANQGQ